MSTMKTIIFLKGLPASGKSTWAREYLEKNTNVKRVNKDDLRAMLDNSKWSHANEKFVLQLRDHIVIESLQKGFHVIVDDTNLHPKHEERMRQIARENNAVVEVKFFDTPLEECLRRDAARANSVGVTTIRQMYDQYMGSDVSELPLDKIWIIADTHFTHQMLIDEEIRPDCYNELIIENWKNMVQPDDIVIHLGDVIFGHNKERIKDILNNLPGIKYLVKGNHDYKPDGWWLDNGFDHVYQRLTWNDVVFTHIPEKIPAGKKYNIHGHLHTYEGHRFDEVKHMLEKTNILVSLEYNDYKPEKLKDLLDEANRKSGQSQQQGQ